MAELAAHAGTAAVEVNVFILMDGQSDEGKQQTRMPHYTNY